MRWFVRLRHCNLLISHGKSKTPQPRATQRTWFTAHREFRATQRTWFRETSLRCGVDGTRDDTTAVMKTDLFNEVDKKNRETFLASIGYFYERSVHRRGHVEFILSALKHMEEFGVEKDIAAYNALLDAFPKGTMIPTNMFQIDFMHYPRQQECAGTLLEQMENNAVIPTEETENILLNAFGDWSHPIRKMRRMLYWMPKFKNASPWPLPDHLPNASIELAKLALQRMCCVDFHTKITVYETAELSDSLDETWVASAQSVSQQQLISFLPAKSVVFIEGPYRIWLRSTSLAYFILRADPQHLPKYEDPHDQDDVSNIQIPFYGMKTRRPGREICTEHAVHQQEDGTFLCVCITGTSSRDSVVSWVRLLERTNSNLANISVVFTQASPITGVIPYADTETTNIVNLAQDNVNTDHVNTPTDHVNKHIDNVNNYKTPLDKMMNKIRKG